jgi:hypothetical protein
MINLEDLAMPVTIFFAVVVLGWFAWGTQTNVRAGDRVMKWLQGGLPIIGEKTALHWMGSSVMQLRIAKGKAPFRSAETLVVFEPRDVIFLWLLSRLQGRRDLMIFRGTLNSAPGFELEILDPNGWTTNQTKRDVQKKNWTPMEIAGHASLRAFRSGDADVVTAKRVADLATRVGAKLVRLSIHRDLPNVEVHLLLPKIETDRAHDVFSTIREIGEEVQRG